MKTAFTSALMKHHKSNHGLRFLEKY